MRLMTITKETQGWRKNDFCFPKEGEIAVFGFECDTDRDDIDGTCGCRRAMIGIKSQNASTTMKVMEINMTEQQLRDRIKEYFVQTKWSDLFNPEELRDITKTYQRDLMRIGSYFTEGAVVEKRGDQFHHRKEGVWKPIQ
jgi:hypothetical protein